MSEKPSVFQQNFLVGIVKTEFSESKGTFWDFKKIKRHPNFRFQKKNQTTGGIVYFVFKIMTEKVRTLLRKRLYHTQ